MDKITEINNDLKAKLSKMPMTDMPYMNNELIIKTAWNNLQYAQNQALIPKDKKTKVGATIMGQGYYEWNKKFFWGCNIKLSESHVYHAELLALLDCLKEHYRPVEVFVTSRNIEENIHCCLDCRGRLLEANPDIGCTVFNPDGSVKYSGRLIDDSQFIMEDKSGKIEWDTVLRGKP